MNDLDELKKLGELYKSGVLTNEEFTILKNELLSKEEDGNTILSSENKINPPNDVSKLQSIIEPPLVKKTEVESKEVATTPTPQPRIESKVVKEIPKAKVTPPIIEDDSNPNKTLYIVLGLILLLIIGSILWFKSGSSRPSALELEAAYKAKEDSSASYLADVAAREQAKQDSINNPVYLIENNGVAGETVSIGNQKWTRRNLDVSTFRNGDTIPEVKTSEEWKEAGRLNKPAFCYHNNNPSDGSLYGKLYNWWAVVDERGLAPEGFHIPNSDEWSILLNYLGHERYVQFSTIAGVKLVSETGFSALLGGHRSDGGFFDDFEKDNHYWQRGNWWTSDGSCLTPPCEFVSIRSVELKNDLTISGPSSNFETQNAGMSIRCIKGLLDTAGSRITAKAQLENDFSIAKSIHEAEKSIEPTKNQTTKTYSTDGQKCSSCGLGHYSGGFCGMCGAASGERVYESYSKAAKCEYCGGSGFVSAGGIHDRKKVCPSCKGTGKQIY